MREAVIVSGVRTAIGKMGGTLKDVLAEQLASSVITGALTNLKIDLSMIDEVIIGCTKQSCDAPNLARVAALYAKLPVKTPAYTVHRQCGSGLQAVISGTQAILLGDAKIVVAGGAESMSTAGYYLRNARYGYGAGNGVILDPNTESQPKSQPEADYGRLTMGMTAENLAEKYAITRVQQDEFAYQSQKKAAIAIESGRFNEEIVPLEVKIGKEMKLFATDEFPRKDASLEKLAKLKPAFKQDGTVTAGNSSGRNDGAAALVMMEKRVAEDLGLKPLLRVVAYASSGVSPEIMGIGPVPATHKALQAAGLTLEDIGLIELNEAFAAQSLAVIQELGLDIRKINVNGGAIALGHPLGSSGARITVTLLHEMVKRDIRYGLATLCIAGGQGIAAIFEKI